MATRQRQGGTRSNLTRTHSRTSSNTSSKIGLNNLQFTQRDAAVAKQPKKGGQHHDSHLKNAALPRVSSGLRVVSKEQIAPLAQRRLPDKAVYQKPNGNKQRKADFSLESPGSDDEDEWVSSESGVATPVMEGSDDEDNTKVQQPPFMAPVLEIPPTTRAPPPLAVETQTPKAEPSAFSRVDTSQPAEAAQSFSPTTPPASGQHPLLTAATQPNSPQRRQESSHSRRATLGTRSETTSPTHPHPPRRSHGHSHHSSMQRPPSIYSIGRDGQPLRPHPLIRGHSYGQAAPRLAPLTSAEPVKAEIASAAPSTPVSPTGSKIIQSSPDSMASSNRRSSVSSARSVATLPAQSISRGTKPSGFDRQRTLSTLASSGASSSALASLAALPTATRPSSPQFRITTFPQEKPAHRLESIHRLLPLPYLNTHLSVLMYAQPAEQALVRVSLARKNRDRQ